MQRGKENLNKIQYRWIFNVEIFVHYQTQEKSTYSCVQLLFGMSGANHSHIIQRKLCISVECRANAYAHCFVRLYVYGERVFFYNIPLLYTSTYVIRFCVMILCDICKCSEYTSRGVWNTLCFAHIREMVWGALSTPPERRHILNIFVSFSPCKMYACRMCRSRSREYLYLNSVVIRISPHTMSTLLIWIFLSKSPTSRVLARRKIRFTMLHI